ncbi:hypothetical protein A3G67_05035 [Candidatus Roizmanbacteria bacterium RIFCSPLOWO2_12_FULL_40_12]|uniref:Uncharacterized protein n=1 Tax=Candidatus Roizmanbacteria bacterium RIFCSPLOWO2_01_FULL_40_42 TaxID=1802066 RepID=A0A1F7J4H2_9BACT|nr:MAG: hypothetical protein A2779_04115 [Candidatus Roizmanbacteria bacterium RIFCSPHIGHO2_01_FULL_40_98]OGK27263.1 MAG: hypothetical protein A3C31_04440 [Candidatus Roizmanbacteria bacterium RIFCSPHIGHO2_02_FULL_40_53]OGK30865.1 MAG: hypothetical protein A2W49_02600 [Candidatus Roizmanbacteria bacterium RIFCSPHIGHO2_12_41_18]OGK36368.1 MAG: hypothetical protein A3E69_02065 [Candidatus Roizmanbacteria bacterium RIFCSPHIGHO2_12_FULL_40_130]OGK50496.1 MAG: hypothetical protein A3B50_01795 [Candi
MKFFIKTFGCQQNVADSERIASAFKARGINPTSSYERANYVIVNTCMVRQSAEHRVYGLVHNLGKIKQQKQKKNEFFKIVVTGCMVGIAFRDKSGEFLKTIRKRMPDVDEFMPIEEVGFDLESIRVNQKHALVPISNGCNNFCTFCIVPFTRGREVSRPFEDIVNECLNLKNKGYTEVTLLGQNVNSYGADLLIGENNIQKTRDLKKTYFQKKDLAHPRVKIEFKLNGEKIEPVYVKHLGRYRIPTLFPYLLEAVAKLGFEKIHFYSSNPWDFSDELIEVISRNKNITRTIHLPIQSGDNKVLKRMNRWYTKQQYINLINKMKKKIPEIAFTTDIIVGFCGETEKEFKSTVEVAKEVGYKKAYLSIYSQRPLTAATKVMNDDVPHAVKKQRWQYLEDLINKPYLEQLRQSN